MQPKKRVIAAQSIGMLLALGVGVLIGARSCGKTETHREYMMPTKQQPEVVEKIVYECPPEVPEIQLEKGDQKRGKTVNRRIKAKVKSELPADNVQSQNKRKRLLAVVRAKSKATLTSCRGSDKQVYRLSVSLVAKKNGSVSTVKINAPPGEVPAGILNCLRGRMKKWTLPESDVVAQQPIIWGLTL